MKVTIYYSECQLKHAVDFIAKHDPLWKGQRKSVKESILDHMSEMAFNSEQWMNGTGSYILASEHFAEDLNNDTNIVSFTIYVDPSLGKVIDLSNDTIEWDVESVEH